MAKKHLVSFTDQEVREFLAEKEVELCGQYGEDVHKSLKFNMLGTARVYNNRLLVLTTHDIQKAIAHYNLL